MAIRLYGRVRVSSPRTNELLEEFHLVGGEVSWNPIWIHGNVGEPRSGADRRWATGLGVSSCTDTNKQIPCTSVAEGTLIVLLGWPIHLRAALQARWLVLSIEAHGPRMFRWFTPSWSGANLVHWSQQCHQGHHDFIPLIIRGRRFLVVDSLVSLSTLSLVQLIIRNIAESS